MSFSKNIKNINNMISKNNSSFDHIIVGAGPAGLFAAYELINKKPKSKICIIEKGNLIQNRKPEETMSGVGGTGAYSDGKIHITPVLSHEKLFHLYNSQQLEELLNEVDEIFSFFGVDAPYTPENYNDAIPLLEECRQKEIHLVVRKTRHIGSDLLPKIIQNFQNHLIKNNVKIYSKTEVKDLIIDNKKKCTGVVLSDNKKIKAKKIFLAPGREGAKWLQDLCTSYEIPYHHDKVEIGVRVEFPAILMKRFIEVMYESIFMIRSNTFDDIVRTFCPCPNGYVTVEKYKDFISVNGHSNSDNGALNSNFALVSEVNLTEPTENTISYALSIAKLATTLGGGKPIVQRLIDLKNGRRSNWERINKGFVNPSLTDVTPGDISMALPYRIVVNLKEALETLDRVMPGINSGSTLLYAPEIKLRSSKIFTNRHLETNIKNLYVGGDASGLSGSITGAAVTGLISARNMALKK
jgi:uncharacterized FAD-dependent dehydrogenase